MPGTMLSTGHSRNKINVVPSSQSLQTNEKDKG